MKKILHLFYSFGFFYTQIGMAQTDSFTYKMNSWIVSSQFFEGSGVPPITTCDYQFIADTLVGEKNYQKLSYKSTSCNNFIFVGTALIRSEGRNKIYALTPDCRLDLPFCSAKREVLLYDFSLNKGDSIINYLQSKKIGNGDTSTRKIVSRIINVDTVLIYGKLRKRLAVNYSDSNRITGNDYWIEGIGSTRHPLSPLITETAICFEFSIRLSCFKGISISGSNCLSAVEDNFLVSKITLYPNPANDLLRVTFATNADILKKILITDVSGRLLKNITVQADELTIDIKDLSAGFYFLRVQTENGTSIKKFLVSR